MCDATPMLRFESFETATFILSSVKATYMIKKMYRLWKNCITFEWANTTRIRVRPN